MVGNNSTAIIGNAGSADDDSQNDTSADDIDSDGEGQTHVLKPHTDDRERTVDVDAQNE